MRFFSRVGCVQFTDWISKHNLQSSALLDFLSSLPKAPSIFDRTDQKDTKVDLDFGSIEKALGLVKAAFLGKLPKLAEQIELVFSETEFTSLSAHDNLNPPYFVAQSEGQSTVCVAFDGSARCMIDLAHEYGHALEFYISGKTLISPIYREFFAFICEAVLIDHMASARPEQAEALRSVMRDDDKTYLIDDFSNLAQSLRSEEAEYNYRWNYPVARYLSNWAVENFETEKLELLFEQSKSLDEFLHVNHILRMSSSRNYLPKLPYLDDETPSAAYAQLGAMTMLDIDYWEGRSETNISDYYTNLLGHLQSKSAFLLFDTAKRPIAYATWNKNDEQDSYVLDRQSAPFGDHLMLQNALSKHLKGKNVLSKNPRSSRKEQLAW